MPHNHVITPVFHRRSRAMRDLDSPQAAAIHHFSIKKMPSIKGLTAVSLQGTPDRPETASDILLDEQNKSNFQIISQDWSYNEGMDDDCGDSASSSIVHSPPRKKFRVEKSQGHLYEYPSTPAATCDITQGSHGIEDNDCHLEGNDVQMSESGSSRLWWRKHTKMDCYKHKSEDCIQAIKSSGFIPKNHHVDTDALTCHVCCQPIISRHSSTAILGNSSTCTLHGPSSTTRSSFPTHGEMNNAQPVNQEQQKQQISLWSFFHPTKKQQSRSSMQDYSCETVARQHSEKLNAPSCTMSCCAYCDRPACQSCMRACEGGCNEYYCTFCSTIDYQGVQEKLLCFTCRDDNVGGNGDDVHLQHSCCRMDTSC